MSVMSGIDDWWAGGRRERVGDHDVFVRVEGPADGRWLTLLHGFPTCSFDWQPIVAPLTAAGHRLLMFDFLGFGDSDKPRGRYSYDQQLAIVRGLWTQLDVERTAVVAHDYGVSVGQELIAAGDPQVDRVAFLNGGLFARLHRALRVQKALRNPLTGPALARAMNESAFARGMRKVFSETHQPSDEEMHELWLSVDRRDGKLVQSELLRYIDERRENEARWTAAIEAPGVPLAFVWGEADPVSGAHMLEEVRRRAPADARIASRADVSHYPQLEEPDWVAAELVEFLAV
jgi:pimeloyl-ACP methyl ester carboxylesterase